MEVCIHMFRKMLAIAVAIILLSAFSAVADEDTQVTGSSSVILGVDLSSPEFGMVTEVATELNVGPFSFETTTNPDYSVNYVSPDIGGNPLAGSSYEGDVGVVMGFVDGPISLKVSALSNQDDWGDYVLIGALGIEAGSLLDVEVSVGYNRFGDTMEEDSEIDLGAEAVFSIGQNVDLITRWDGTVAEALVWDLGASLMVGFSWDNSSYVSFDAGMDGEVGLESVGAEISFVEGDGIAGFHPAIGAKVSLGLMEVTNFNMWDAEMYLSYLYRKVQSFVEVGTNNDFSVVPIRAGVNVYPVESITVTAQYENDDIVGASDATQIVSLGMIVAY